ncbi:hypothetical protein GCM10011414_14180 [Croceivirga lutea]|uniref:tetratricopeptide repeat protein n=1 Tax=Croceivirga lutea TaxID=1775167 RepID=UPI001639DA34|nr:tetratricopeptide repeat protein [Croceivirga lutea]GGG45756.1 hypothetical protein GCM10011414_14180 [Croceivirga lutea]
MFCKKAILVLFIIFNYAFVYSQKSVSDSKIDSLKNILNSTDNLDSKVEIYNQLFTTTISTDQNKAKVFLDSIQQLQQVTKTSFSKAIYNKCEGLYAYYQSDFKTSISNCEKAIELFTAIDKPQQVPDLLNQIGVGLKYLGRFEEAITYHQKAVEMVLEIKGNPKDLARSYLNMGNVMAEVKNFDSSTQYYRMAEDVCLENNMNQYILKVWGNLAANFNDIKDYSTALTYYNKSIELSKKKPSIDLTRLYNNVGVVYDNLENYKEAKKYYLAALKSSEKHGEPQLVGLITRNIGETYLAERNYTKALAFINKSVTIAEETNNTVRLIRGNKMLAEVYSAMSDYKKAFEYNKLYNKLEDSIRGIQIKERINDIEVKYQTEKKETEIALQQEEINTLNEKSRADNLKKGLFAGGMFTFLAVSGLLFFGFRQRMKKNRIAREKQEEIYKKEIAHKQKELASQTLHLVQKNTFIQELMQNLESIKNSPEKFKMEFRRIVMLLKKENASDKDWEVFKTYFSEVHNDFDQKLRTLYPDISEKELRLATFLRMNLTTKEIAATLNVLPDSILKSKYRLKKKIGLDKEIDLTSFLNDL